MKQMSMGVQPDCKTPFVYPQELLAGGLKPTHKITKSSSSSVATTSNSWSRLWIEAERIPGCDFEISGGVRIVTIRDVIMKINSKQMSRDSRGVLCDQVNQDLNDSSVIFAQKFTELYDTIGRYYPCFLKLKQAYKSIALARWVYENRIPISSSAIDHLYNKEKSVLNPTTLATKSLTFTETSVTSTSTHTHTHTVHVFGGVNMMCSNSNLSFINPEEKKQIVESLTCKPFLSLEVQYCDQCCEELLFDFERLTYYCTHIMDHDQDVFEEEEQQQQDCRYNTTSTSRSAVRASTGIEEDCFYFDAVSSNPLPNVVREEWQDEELNAVIELSKQTANQSQFTNREEDANLKKALEMSASEGRRERLENEHVQLKRALEISRQDHNVTKDAELERALEISRQDCGRKERVLEVSGSEKLDEEVQLKRALEISREYSRRKEEPEVVDEEDVELSVALAMSRSIW